MSQKTSAPNAQSALQTPINVSLLFGILSSLFCILGGLYLCTIQSAAENTTVFEAMAHGIGVYCIGKGLYVGPSLIAQGKAARASRPTQIRRRVVSTTSSDE